MANIESGRRQRRAEVKGRSPNERREVSPSHVRVALVERAGIRMESVTGRVDWPDVLAAAAPFQDQAAAVLGVGLRTAVVLRDTIAGARLAIVNARDWGEGELGAAIAEHGYGDR